MPDVRLHQVVSPEQESELSSGNKQTCHRSCVTCYDFASAKRFHVRVSTGKTSLRLYFLSSRVCLGFFIPEEPYFVQLLVWKKNK